MAVAKVSGLVGADFGCRAGREFRIGELARLAFGGGNRVCSGGETGLQDGMCCRAGVPIMLQPEGLRAGAALKGVGFDRRAAAGGRW